jgi:hypothetical protein
LKVECPTGSGRLVTHYQVAEETVRRLSNIFLKDKDGRPPVDGSPERFQADPFLRDCVLLYEYFHGDSVAGLRASHYTGRTGIVARMMHLFATTTPEQVLQMGQAAGVVEARAPRGKPRAAVARGKS